MKRKTAAWMGPAILALLAALWPLLVLAQSADSTAAQLQQKLRSLKSLEADFRQTYYSGTVTQPLQEQGKLYFQKPDAMRWEYQKPERRVFLYKNDIFSQYYPEDSQLIRSSLAKAQYESEVLSLLAGRKNLEEDYRVQPDLSSPEAKAAGRLKLTPKVEGQYSLILLDVDPKSGLIHRAVFEEPAGNRMEFIFSNIKENPALKASVFVLEVPPGTEIIDEAGLTTPDKEGSRADLAEIEPQPRRRGA